MWPVIGHEMAVDCLKRGLAKGSLSHAYLLVGPPRVGKATLALSLAQALNCEAEDKPCGVCSQCRKIQARSHPDVLVLGLGTGSESGRPRTEIGIDSIRDIQHWASLPPFEGRHRLFIIEQAESLSLEAANCLLKTLEEPLPGVFFILLSSQPERLPDTVISRCQKLTLRPLAEDRIEALLLARGQATERARLLARLSRGAPGWALAALEDEGLLSSRQERLNRLIDIISEGYEERFELAGELAGGGQGREDVSAVLEAWLLLWRDLLLIKAGTPGAITNLDFNDILSSLAAALTLPQIRSFVSRLVLSQKQLRQNINARLLLEVLMLDMPVVGKVRVGS